MLIDVGFKDNDLVTIKLVTGDEIMARFREEKPQSYKVHRAVTLQPTAQGLAMVPYAMTVSDDTSLEILKSSCVFITKTRSEIEPAYIQATTGISTINTNNIVR
jgi:hypothetical protein